MATLPVVGSTNTMLELAPRIGGVGVTSTVYETRERSPPAPASRRKRASVLKLWPAVLLL